VIHKLNKTKIHEELARRGWTVNQYLAHEAPLNRSPAEQEEDWVQAVLAGIECELEAKLRSNKEFLKKYPTAKRT
jgi:hypothetical protein